MAVVGGGSSIVEYLRLEALNLCGLSAAHSALIFPLYVEPRVESKYPSDIIYIITYDGAHSYSTRLRCKMVTTACKGLC